MPEQSHSPIDNLITEHMDIWSSAIKRKSSSGRGSSKKIELYGIKKLRELILELAVRGKLVAQDASDEPASVLLERIAKEKAQLVKEGKIKKQKPLPPISEDEKLFELPEGWKWCRADDICYGITSGSTPPKTEFKESEGVPYLKVYNIRNQKIDFEYQPQFVSESYHASKLARSVLRPGDVVMNIVGPPLGKIAIIPITYAEWNCNQAIVFFRAIDSRLSSYIYQYLVAGMFLNSIELIGTAGQDNISVTKSRSIVFPMPPLSEQNRIVTKVNELMALCDQLEAQTESSLDAHQTLVTVLLDTLVNSQNAEELAENWTRISGRFDTLFTTEQSIDQLKKTILQLAVMGKLVEQNPNDEPASALLERIAAEKADLIKQGKIKKQKPLPPITEDEKPFELPEGWVGCRLGELIPQFQNGASSRGDKKGRDVVVLRLADMKDWQVSFADTRTILIEEESISRYSLDKGDVLIIRVNGSADIVGRFITCKDNYDAIYCDHFIRMRFPIEVFCSEFISLLGSSNLIRGMISQLFVSTAGQKTVNQTHISSLVVTVPPLQEQHRIVAKVDELMAICDQLKAQLSEAQTTQLNLADALVEQAL
jgi:type I restriction enzyme S subunit